MEDSKSALSQLVDTWPSPFVLRSQVEKFSNGILTSGYMAVLDSLRKGPASRFKIGRKVAYQVGDLVSWLEGRTTQCK